MKKKCIINQPVGLGDILFCIPIARHYYDQGYEILWPTDFTSIQKHFKFIQFVPSNSISFDQNNMNIQENDEGLVLPLRWCNNLLNNGNPITTMSDKYKFCNLPLEMWKQLKWERDESAEEELFERLGLKDVSYNLISEVFTPSFSMKYEIKIQNGLQNVHLQKLDNYTLLDWGKVIENATNLYTVGSSINVIIEVMATKHKEYILYPRWPHEINCQNYNYLYKKPTGEHKL